MPKPPRIIGLDAFGLTHDALGRLGPYVKNLMIDTIEGRRPRVRRPSLAWFCVCGVVAIQIEGQIKGSLDLEDRLVLVKAIDADDAQRRLQRMWTRYAEP